MLDLVLTGAFSYAFMTSSLGAMITEAFYKVYQGLVGEPLITPFVNTTVAAFQTATEVMKPVSTLTLSILKQFTTALVLLTRYVAHLIILTQNTTKAFVSWFRTNGLDVGVATQNFAHSLLVITKAFGTLLFYVAQGLSAVIMAFEESREFASKVSSEPGALTWDFFKAHAYSLMLSTTVLTLFTWWLLKPTRVQTAILVKTEKPQRMETRASRKRAMLTCGS
jgi:hypothetical protein